MTEELLKQVGRALQKQRKKAGYGSAQDFAESNGENLNTYTAYEQGKNALPIKKAFKYADIFNCTLDELCGRSVTNIELDILEKELVENYRASTPERQDRLIDTARDFAAMSKGTAERDEFSSPQVSA